MLLTKGGAMVFSQDEITAMKVSEDVHLSIISTPGKTNYFLEWGVYKHVQASRMVMYAPDGSETATVLSWKSPDTGRNLRKWLDDTQLVRERENITRLETMINQTTQLALSDYEIGYLGLNTSKKSFFEKLAWFSLGFTLLSITIFVVLQCIKRGIVVRQITNLTQTLSHLTMDRERTRQHPTGELETIPKPHHSNVQDPTAPDFEERGEEEPTYMTMKRGKRYCPLAPITEEGSPVVYTPRVVDPPLEDERTPSLRTAMIRRVENTVTFQPQPPEQFESKPDRSKDNLYPPLVQSC
eukprot:sb/3467455/